MYLRLSVTDKCDFRCWYCRPATQAPAAQCTPRLDAQSLLGLVGALHEAVPLHKVRITGGEPLLRADLPEMISVLRGLLPDAELALTTNGFRLADRAASLHHAGLNRINVSLDSTDPQQFRRITGVDGLEQVRQGLSAARDAGFDEPKLNSVLLRTGAGAELERLLAFAAQRQAELRFIELMPFGLDARSYAREFLAADDAFAMLAQLAQHQGPLAESGTAERHWFTYEGTDVVVGLIRSVSHPFCTRCDRLRLDARGQLRPCLRRADHIDLPELVERTGTALAATLKDTLAGKSESTRRWPNLSMAAIGG